MGMFDFITKPLEQGIRDIGNAIAPGSGDDLLKVAEIAAMYYLPGMAGEWAGAQFMAAGPSQFAIYASQAAKAATSLFILSEMAGNAGAVDTVSTAMASGVLVNTANNVAQIPVIYGTRKVGGTRVFVNVSGSNNEYLHVIVVLSEGQIDSATNVYIDDVLITDAKFSGGLATYQFFDGPDAQASIASLMVDLPTLWSAFHNGNGVAYLYVKCKFDRTAFSGFPTITADVKGKKVYDPRTSTTVWSDNPALCIRDYLTNTRYGKGLPTGLIDDASIIAAANYCDEAVTVPGGTQKRYTCNGVLSVDNSAYNNVKSLLTSCRGMLIFSAGKYKLILDKAATAAFTFDEDNITGNWTISTSGRKDRVNRVTGTFYDPGNNWQPNYGISDSPAYRTVDNGLLLETSIDLPFTANLYTAQQLAGLQLKQSRFGLTVSFTAFQSALRCEVGDVVSITHSTPGWSGKLFRVLQLTLREDDDIDVVCHEYDSTVYNLDTLTAITSTSTLSLPSPFSITAPTSLTLSSGTSDLLLGGDGTIISRIKCVFTPPANVFTNVAEIQYKLSTDSVWQSMPPADATQGIAYIAPVKDGLTYNVRFRFSNTMGVQTAWFTASAHTVVGKTAAPINVSGLAYSTNEAGVLLSWTTCTDKDYQDTTLRVGASWAAGTNIYTGTSNTFLWTRPTGTSFNIWAKHRDTSQNESTTETLLAVTYAAVAIANSGITLSSAGVLSGAGGGTLALGSIGGSLTSGQIAAGIITANAFASSIEPVSVVTSTPGVLSTRSIFNTTTGTLLTWNGSAYVAPGGLPGAGTLTSSMFASTIEPVTIVSSVPGTLSTKSIFNTTDSKMYRWNGTSYIATIAGSDISGTVPAASIGAGLTASQISSVNAAAVGAGLTAAQISSVNASAVGAGLTAAQISSVNAAAVGNGLTGTQIAATTITASNIVGGTITASQIAANTITGSNIAGTTITAANIVGGTITASQIAANTITGTNIAGTTITGANMVAGTVTASQIAANTITASQIASGTITATQIATDTITAGQIAAGAITSSELAAGAVIAGKITAGSIVAADLAANTITAGQIAAGAITATQLAANTITAGQIAANTITASQIAGNTITASQIAANTITASQIAAGAITATQIAAATITTDRIVVGAATAINAAGSISAVGLAPGGTNSIATNTANVLSGSGFAPTTSAVTVTVTVGIYIVGTNASVYNYTGIIKLINAASGLDIDIGWSTQSYVVYAAPRVTSNRQATVFITFTGRWNSLIPGTSYNFYIRGTAIAENSTGSLLNFNLNDALSVSGACVITENKV